MKNAPAPAAASATNGHWDQAALAARIIVGLVFIISGFNKAIHPAEEFAAVIESYYILSPADCLTAAKILPWTELIAGTFLVFGYLTRAAAAVMGASLVMFLIALFSLIQKNIPIENCGCFGKWLHLTPPQAMMMDSVLLLFAVLAFKKGRRLMSLDNWVEQGG